MGSEERLAWERKQRENRIIDIAQEVFFTRGYENTTMPQIAEAAGYNKRTIYLYFKEKEEIFLAVVKRGLNLLHEMLKESCSESANGVPELRAMGEVFFKYSLAHSDYLKLIMLFESNNCIYYEGQKGASIQNKYQKDCQKKTDEIAELMTNVLDKAIKRGAIKTDLTPVQLMLILWGQVFGVMQIISMRKEYFSDAFGIGYHQLFESFMDLVEKGLSS